MIHFCATRLAQYNFRELFFLTLINIDILGHIKICQNISSKRHMMMANTHVIVFWCWVFSSVTVSEAVALLSKFLNRFMALNGKWWKAWFTIYWKHQETSMLFFFTTDMTRKPNLENNTDIIVRCIQTEMHFLKQKMF